MNTTMERLEQELSALRASSRRWRMGGVGAGACAAALAAAGLSRDPVPDEVRARRFVLVDDAGVVRAMLQQDDQGADRRSRSAGLLIFDKHGHERGGLGTLDDGSAILALDAPKGVGAPMRDRIGMVVNPDGSSYVMVIDNQTRGVARLDSDAQGNGGVKVFKWDMDAKQVHVKTFTFDGETTETVPMGG